VIRGAAVAAALLCTGVVEAQEASILLGGSRAHYADSLDGTAGFVAGRISAGRGRQAGELDAAFSAYTDGGWALQVSGQSTLLWRAGRGRGPYLGLAGGGVLNLYEGGTPSGSFAIGPLVAVAAGRSFLSLGAVGGVLRRVDSTWSRLGSGAIRWQWVPPGVLSLDAGVTLTGADTNRLADLSLGLRVRSTPVQLTGVAGTRVGDLADGAWGSLEVVWHATPLVSLEAVAGRFPRDLAGFSEGFYAQAGLRFGTRRALGPAPPPLIVTAIGAGRVRVAVRYRRAVVALAITGSWNGWTEIPLRRDSGWWVTELPIGPGVYRYALVADGVWRLPDGVKGVPDEFGGEVAQLIVR
jgi:hypothetical protein